LQFLRHSFDIAGQKSGIIDIPDDIRCYFELLFIEFAVANLVE